MVGLGMAMLLLGVWALWARWRKRLYDSKLLLRFALCMGPAGLVAILAGWFTTEVGRQPWIVYGIMRTKDAVSNHSVMTMTWTLLMFVVVYFAVFGTGLGYMLRLVAMGPKTHNPDGPGQPAATGNARPARPLSAAPNEADLESDSRSVKEE